LSILTLRLWFDKHDLFLANYKRRIALFQKFSAEFSDVQPHLVRRAVYEADALASLTAIPHLLLPVLAEEKVLNARNWSRHQQTAFQRSRLGRAA